MLCLFERIIADRQSDGQCIGKYFKTKLQTKLQIED